VLYISHRLEEIREIGDRVTVLKDGVTSAADLPARTTPQRELVSRMTGRTIEYVFPPHTTPPDLDDRPDVLRVEGLTRYGEFLDVSLHVRAGEVVGIAGLVGSGRSELLETVYGARAAHSGTVAVDGRRVPGGRVGAAVRAGMAMAPEERKSQALLLDEPVWRNITLASMSKWASGGFTGPAPRSARPAWPPPTCRSARPTYDGRSAPSPAATSRRSSWPAGSWGRPPSCCCSTSRRAASTSARAPSSTASSAAWPTRASACCSCRARSPRCSPGRPRAGHARGRIVHEATAATIDEATVLDLVMGSEIAKEIA